MKQFLVGGLLIGGAYFLFKDNIAQFLQGSSSSTHAADTPATPTTPATPAPAATTAALGTLARLKSYLIANGQSALLTSVAGPDTWDYFLMAANPGFTAPAPEVVWPNKADPREATTLDVWFTAIAPFLKSSGLAGAPRAIAPKHRAGRLAWS